MGRVLASPSQGLKKASMVGLYNALRGKPHGHFCRNRECRAYYEDNCQTTESNALCEACSGRRRTWSIPRDPQECCLDNTIQLTSPEDLQRYACAGPGPWFKCKTCARTNGWNCSTAD